MSTDSLQTFNGVKERILSVEKSLETFKVDVCVRQHKELKDTIADLKQNIKGMKGLLWGIFVTLFGGVAVLVIKAWVIPPPEPSITFLEMQKTLSSNQQVLSDTQKRIVITLEHFQKELNNFERNTKNKNK